jgi:hypothetical protein
MGLVMDLYFRFMVIQRSWSYTPLIISDEGIKVKFVRYILVDTYQIQARMLIIPKAHNPTYKE